MKYDNATEQVLNLLKGSDLPIDDIRGNQDISFLREYVSGALTGVVGIETLGSLALLRSLAVDSAYRGMGIGSRLVRSAIEEIDRRGYKDLYLLTTDAQAYFARFGFREMDRNLAPEGIRQCSQFKDLCPDDAILMIKDL
jgi:amino-acid N-acetyltransferase